MNADPALVDGYRKALWGCGDPYAPPVDTIVHALTRPNLPDLMRIRKIAVAGLRHYGLAQGPRELWHDGAIDVTTALVKSAQSIGVRTGLGTDNVVNAVAAQLALELGREVFPCGLTLYWWSDHTSQEEVIAALLRERPS